MSLGLLGSYDSESESENDCESESEETEQPLHRAADGSHETVSIKEAGGGKDGIATTTNTPDTACVSPDSEGVTEDQVGGSPVTAYYGLSGGGELVDSDTSGSPTSDEEGEGCEKTGTIREKSPLPLPELDGSDRLTSSSVFSNPYREAEEAKLAVLKQHVDLSQSMEPSKERHKWSSKRGKKRHSQFQPSQFGGDSGLGNQCGNDRGSPPGPGGQRKHRSGVREGLEPPKKYMKTHLKIQSHERPWTAR